MKKLLTLITIVLVVLCGCQENKHTVGKTVKIEYHFTPAKMYPTRSELGSNHYPIRFDVSGRKEYLLIS